jgi:DNA-binding MarR family transcriptional regulator
MPAGAPPAGVGVREATGLLRQILDTTAEFELALGGELDVTPRDLEAMEHLISRGPMSPTDLAQRLSISTAATTALVDRLIAVGHVRREAHPTDRRSILVVPSEASVGRAMSRIMPMIMGVDGALDEFSDDERTVITEYLRRVLEVYRSHIATPEG